MVAPRRTLLCLAQMVSGGVPLRCVTLSHQLVVRASSRYVANAVWVVFVHADESQHGLVD